MKNIGIDIGGTFIKAAVVQEDGTLSEPVKEPTPKSGAELPEFVCGMIEKILHEGGIPLEEIGSIGIGAPGICDSKKGVIVNCPNIPFCENIPICEHVKERIGVKTYLDNDANCAALGEYMAQGSGCDGFVFITLGTGVGGGIILNGKLLRGVNSAAGEIGHMVIQQDGEECNCGRRGCWERYASVSALVRQAKAAGMTGEVSGRSVFEEREKGSKTACAVVDRWLRYVAEGICDTVNIFQPDIIVIGGGISREGDIILKPIEEYVRKNSMIGEKTKIMISSFFNAAGVIGAGCLYTQN